MSSLCVQISVQIQNNSLWKEYILSALRILKYLNYHHELCVTAAAPVLISRTNQTKTSCFGPFAVSLPHISPSVPTIYSPAVKQKEDKHTLTYTDSWLPDILNRVFVVERFAHLTVASHGVVLTVITHPSTDISSGQIHSHVKVAHV